MSIDDLDRGGVARHFAGAHEQERRRRAAARHGLGQQRRVVLAASRLLPRGAAEGEHVADRTFQRHAERAGDLAVGHVEVAAGQAEDVQQLRRGGGALLVCFGRLPVGHRFVQQRRQLFRRDERVDLRDDQQPSAAEQRAGAIGVEHRGELRARLERLDGDTRPRGEDGVANVAEGLFGEIVARAADENCGGGRALRDLREDGVQRLRHGRNAECRMQNAERINRSLLHSALCILHSRATRATPSPATPGNQCSTASRAPRRGAFRRSGCCSWCRCRSCLPEFD